jgi:hypothetical protein
VTSTSRLLPGIPRERRLVCHGELRRSTCAANDRLRHARPYGGMLAVTAPTIGATSPLTITDGGARAGRQRAQPHGYRTEACSKVPHALGGSGMEVGLPARLV